MKKVYFLLIVFVASLCHAQWSDDPSVNNPICTLNGEQNVPKAVPCPDGSVYVSWFSNDSGNYDVRLQRLDSQGNLLWQQDGIVVSDHPQMTWLTDWDLVTDMQGNAILAFQDVRYHDNPDIFVYKISPDGSFLWGEDGVTLTNDNESYFVPRLAVTDAGNVIVCWSGEISVLVQKLSADGTPVLETPLILMNASVSHTHPQVMPVAGDSFILKYFKDSGPPWAPTRHLFACRYGPDVTPVWPAELAISTQGGISAWTQKLPMINDGQDGFWTAWYDDRDQDMMSQAFVQHVTPDGTLTFPDGGISLTGDAMNQHFMPHLSFAGDGVFAFWQMTNANQSAWGINLQRVTVTGGVQLGTNGVSLIPVGDRVVNPAVSVPVLEGAVLIYRDDASTGTTDNNIRAMRVDMSGQQVWNPAYSAISTVSSEKVHVTATPFGPDQWVTVWEDDRNGNRDVYAQNIRGDGLLGPVPVPSGIQGLVLLDGPGNVTDVTIDVDGQAYHPAMDGTFLIELDPGNWTLSFAHEWYDTVELTGVVVSDGQFTVLDPVTMHYNVSADENFVTPVTFECYPNPFNPETTITFSVPATGVVRLDIFNLKGQLLETLVDDKLEAGNHRVVWNAYAHPSGVYLMRLETGHASETSRVTLMK